MELALVEVEEYDDDFLAFSNTKGGDWKRWKYDSLLNLTSYFTKRFVQTKEGEELHHCPEFTEEDQE